MVYGLPWDEARVSADNAVENIESYRGKRVFLAAGSSPRPHQLARPDHRGPGTRRAAGVRAALDDAGIAYEAHEPAGGHFIRPDLVQCDLGGMIERLRSAG